MAKLQNIVKHLGIIVFSWSFGAYHVSNILEPLP